MAIKPRRSCRASHGRVKHAVPAIKVQFFVHRTPAARPGRQRGRCGLRSRRSNTGRDVQSAWFADQPAGRLAVDRHPRRLARQILHLQENATAGQVHVGRDYTVTAERVGGFHGAQGQRATFRIGCQGCRGRVKSRTRSIGRTGRLPGSSRTGRSCLAAWKTIKTLSSGSSVNASSTWSSCNRR